MTKSMGTHWGKPVFMTVIPKLGILWKETEEQRRPEVQCLCAFCQTYSCLCEESLSGGPP